MDSVHTASARATERRAIAESGGKPPEVESEVRCATVADVERVVKACARAPHAGSRVHLVLSLDVVRRLLSKPCPRCARVDALRDQAVKLGTWWGGHG